jgi:hypothetical protein
MKKLIAAIVIALALPLSASAKSPTMTFGQAPGASPTQAPGPAYFGEQVWFAVDKPASTIEVDCYLGSYLGPLVYSPTQAANSGFQLGPTPAWTGGFAECVATAFASSGHSVAQMSFSVNA